MTPQNSHNTLILAALLTTCSFCTSAIAGPSAQHLGAASTHSAAASAHAGTAVVKGLAAVAATPLIAVGAAGIASAAAGSTLHDFANEPLRIGHEVLHTNPNDKRTTPDPAEQMADPKQEKTP